MDTKNADTLFNPRQLFVVDNFNGVTCTQLAEGDIDSLRVYLDSIVITPDNIGQIRRSLFTNRVSEWNATVRDETAEREINRDAGNKPPLGVIPHNIWLDQRRHALHEAIQRYCAAGKFEDIVFVWLDELRSL